MERGADQHAMNLGHAVIQDDPDWKVNIRIRGPAAVVPVAKQNVLVPVQPNKSTTLMHVIDALQIELGNPDDWEIEALRHRPPNDRARGNLNFTVKDILSCYKVKRDTFLFYLVRKNTDKSVPQPMSVSVHIDRENLRNPQCMQRAKILRAQNVQRRVMQPYMNIPGQATTYQQTNKTFVPLRNGATGRYKPYPSTKPTHVSHNTGPWSCEGYGCYPGTGPWTMPDKRTNYYSGTNEYQPTLGFQSNTGTNHAPGTRPDLLPTPGTGPGVLPKPGTGPGVLPTPGTGPGVLPTPGTGPGVLPTLGTGPEHLPTPGTAPGHLPTPETGRASLSAFGIGASLDNQNGMHTADRNTAGGGPVLKLSPLNKCGLSGGTVTNNGRHVSNSFVHSEPPRSGNEATKNRASPLASANVRVRHDIQSQPEPPRHSIIGFIYFDARQAPLMRKNAETILKRVQKEEEKKERKKSAKPSILKASYHIADDG